MENKYYTPKISDLRVGYECEAMQSRFFAKSKWERIIINAESFRDLLIHHDPITDYSKIFKTPYLNKEQIEAENWFYKTTLCDSEDCKGFVMEYIKEKNNFIYSFSLNQNHIAHIYIWSSELCSRTLYNGYCPSINEFRYICSLLKI